MAAVQYGFGSGVLYGIRNDITGQTPIRFGTMQDVSIEFSAEAKELYGQLQFPVDVARGKAKITGKAKFGQMSGLLFNNIYFGQTMAAGQNLFAYNEAQTMSAAVTATTSAATSAGSPTLTFTSVPATVTVGAPITGVAGVPAGTYVLSKAATTVTMSANATGAGVPITTALTFGCIATAANSATFNTDLGPLYSSTGTPLTYVVGAPTTGQYAVTSGVYVFAAGETGTAILLNYTYTTSSQGFTITGSNLLMGNTPKFQAVFTQSYGGQTTTLKLYSCVSSKLSMPTKIDDYVIPEIDFAAFANASGNVFELTMSGV